VLGEGCHCHHFHRPHQTCHRSCWPTWSSWIVIKGLGSRRSEHHAQTWHIIAHIYPTLLHFIHTCAPFATWLAAYSLFAVCDWLN
jgi:hypothetical protein